MHADSHAEKEDMTWWMSPRPWRMMRHSTDLARDLDSPVHPAVVARLFGKPSSRFVYLLAPQATLWSAEVIVECAGETDPRVGGLLISAVIASVRSLTIPIIPYEPGPDGDLVDRSRRSDTIHSLRKVIRAARGMGGKARRATVEDLLVFGKNYELTDAELWEVMRDLVVGDSAS